MVGVEFKGRLGNQLFQYVFFLYLKARNRRRFVFFPNPHHASVAKYFDLGYRNLFLGAKWYSVLTRIIPRVVRFKDVYVQNFIGPHHYDPQETTLYHGYFQTDWYYRQLDPRPQLKLKKKYTKQFDEQFGAVFRTEKTVVVHIRRTDYLNYHRRDISIPITYFIDRLGEIEQLDTYKVFFISDDMEFVKANIPSRPNFIFSGNSEIIDFQIIMNADIAIISNSTFAWWAAYLGKKDHVVYAPKNWIGYRIGREHPKGIMTDRFIWKA